MIEIYTDGSARSSTNTGGYGILVFKDNKLIEVRSKQYKDVTNNQMELKAILYAMVKYGKFNPIVYSDSAYAIGCFDTWRFSWKNQGWTRKGQEIKNLDIIKAFDDLYEEGKRIQLVKVKGHSNDFKNNIADKLATGEMTEEHVWKYIEPTFY